MKTAMQELIFHIAYKERRKYQDEQEKIIGGMNDYIMYDAIIIQNKVIEELTKEYAEYLEKEKNQMFYWFYAGGGMSAKDEFEVEFEKYYNLEYKKEEVSPQDTPAIDIKKEEETKKGDKDFMYKWIRSKSGK